jgi:hypothetical protein
MAIPAACPFHRVIDGPAEIMFYLAAFGFLDSEIVCVDMREVLTG